LAECRQGYKRADHEVQLFFRVTRKRDATYQLTETRTFQYKETTHHQKSGKCENSDKNWPDYVKITPQNSTDYVKSTY
jgi:hypothetical protein